MLQALHEELLCHVDLHPRNIMVKLQPDNSLEVTGIFARDEAVFAPKFVNCEPSGWLWAYNVDGHVDEDGSLPWPYEVEGANNLPLHQSNKSSSFSSRNVLDLSTRVWRMTSTFDLAGSCSG